MTPAKTDDKPTISDADLLQRHIDGDPQAFEALMGRHRRPLYAFLARFTGDRALAEDVFQETFLQVHRSVGMFDTDRRFKPWLYTVAANKARDAMRSRKRHKTAPLDAAVDASGGNGASFADLLPGDIPLPEEDLMNLETRRAVQELITDLPDDLRVVLTLAYFQNLPYKEMSQILDIPVGTIKSRMHKATRLFAEKYRNWDNRQPRPADGGAGSVQ
ncbi:MAG: sigma-70 family RNA polymerase sigma factor [Planctomycetes bacterium]|jgi:RNA polymerase sigma-70 factor (ECF subfamily)|nr:sigma-70 family RNA polymerase sigma factor [Planctomycetota bacterium]